MVLLGLSHCAPERGWTETHSKRERKLQLGTPPAAKAGSYSLAGFENIDQIQIRFHIIGVRALSALFPIILPFEMQGTDRGRLTSNM